MNSFFSFQTTEGDTIRWHFDANQTKQHKNKKETFLVGSRAGSDLVVVVGDYITHTNRETKK